MAQRGARDLRLKSLKKVLLKFPKKDLLDLWEDHSDFCHFLPNVDIGKPRSKIAADFYNIVVNHSLKTRRLDDLLAKFDLLYVALNSQVRTWKTYEIKKPGQLISDRALLGTQLTKQLNRLKMKIHASTCLRLGSIWLRLSLEPHVSSSGRFIAAYIQYQPHHPFVLISGTLSVKIMENILVALSKVFHSSEIQQLPLKSHHISSLIQMVYQRDGHTFSEIQNLPVILQKAQRKRDALEDIIPEIVNSDLDWQKKKRKYIEKVFGKLEPPKMEKITIFANTQFLDRGQARIEENIKAAVIFKGSDTLVGLSKFVEHGIIKGKMPDYLESLVVSGADTLYVDD